VNRSVVAAFRLAPGELDLHHDLVRWCPEDGGTIKQVAMNLTDRRLVLVMPEEQTGFLRRARALFSGRRVVVELLRADFVRLEYVPARQWSRASLRVHDRDGSVLEILVDDPDLWQKRFDRWVAGDHPSSPLPPARLV
jgi:hypothetical protein